jgi:acetyl esterase/lipase
MNGNRIPRWIKSIGLVMAAGMVLVAHAPGQQTNQIPLWPLPAPLAKGAGPEDTPGVLLFLPSTQQPTPAILICPSDNYSALSMDSDGRQVAEWLNNLGIAAFVLKYRLAPTYRYPAPLLDAQRALRYIRSNASLYNVVKNKIGIMGFSAGGHLAAMAATHFDAGKTSPGDEIDRMSSRPDFLVLIYPVITCSEPFLHALSCENLLGPHPDPGLAAVVSSEKHVTPKTPPTFLFHAYDDATVPVENSVVFFSALRKAGVPAELHIYDHGLHGAGLALEDPVLSTWPKLLENWFRVRGLLPRNVLPEK